MQDTSKVLAAMTALETAIAQTELAYRDENQRVPWAVSTADAVEATKWTRRIEEALDDQDKLINIRIEFDELTLTHITAVLAYNYARHGVFDSYTPLCAGIRAIVEILDDPAFSKLPRHLKPAMQALVLRAIATHRTPRKECDITPIDALADRTSAYGILVATFGVLANDLKRVGKSHAPRYSTDLVIQGRKVRQYLNADVDLRNVYRVPFQDCVNSTHPCSVKLEEAHIAVEQAVKIARDLVKKLRDDQNGKVNERQHAGRMIDLLHGAPQGCGGNIDDQVKAQNQRRLTYETMRLQVMMALDELQARYEDLVVALVDAGAETASLLEEIQGDARTTIDRKDTVRITMNNCLAADRYLREVGREIADLRNNQCRDLTLGNGAAALTAAYDDAAKQYRPFKSSKEDVAKA
ncbi:hypothetical protein BH10CYA1_BH10CYA1_28560 [soil metagenome]